MAIRLDVVGKKSDPMPFEYTWKDTVQYALGVGAKASELDYLFEGRGPKVLPTFAVVPCFPALLQVVAQIEANPFMVVHGEQKVILHRPIAPSGKLTTTCEVKAIYDKGKSAVAVVEARTLDEKGAAVFDNWFTIFARGEGGFGGERGPEAPKHEPPDRAPDFEVVEPTTPEQALLYRLSGDYNPLHAEPGFAKAGGFDRPILHGLCTFGFAGRAVLHSICGGDAARLRSFSARFSGSVFPGDTLVTRGWKRDDGSYVITVATSEGRQVLSNAVAEVAGP